MCLGGLCVLSVCVYVCVVFFLCVCGVCVVVIKIQESKDECVTITGTNIY